MCSVSEQCEMNTFQCVQSSALEGRIKVYKLNCGYYKIKCMKFSDKVMQSLFGFSQLVSFLFISQESHTTLLSVGEVSRSHLNAGNALGERIFSTHSLHLNNSAYESIITNILSVHLNDVSERKNNYHSLVPLHEKRIVVGSLRNLYLGYELC